MARSTRLSTSGRAAARMGAWARPSHQHAPHRLRCFSTTMEHAHGRADAGEGADAGAGAGAGAGASAGADSVGADTHVDAAVPTGRDPGHIVLLPLLLELEGRPAEVVAAAREAAGGGSGAAVGGGDAGAASGAGLEVGTAVVDGGVGTMSGASVTPFDAVLSMYLTLREERVPMSLDTVRDVVTACFDANQPEAALGVLTELLLTGLPAPFSPEAVVSSPLAMAHGPVSLGADTRLCHQVRGVWYCDCVVCVCVCVCVVCVCVPLCA